MVFYIKFYIRSKKAPLRPTSPLEKYFKIAKNVAFFDIKKQKSKKKYCKKRYTMSKAFQGL